MMEFRYFQIVVSIIGVIVLVRQIRKYLKLEVSIYETGFIILFWIFLIVFALFPDYFSVKIAQALGIKDNINAVIFSALGLLFYFQFKLYKLIKKQDETITTLTRRLALNNPEQQKKEDKNL